MNQGDTDTDGGNNTQDRVFLLSYSEAFDMYLSSDEERMCIPTAYAKAHRAFINDRQKLDGKSVGLWWLRSAGTNHSTAACVMSDGTKSYSNVTSFTMSVRPVIWVDLYGIDSLSNIPDNKTKEFQKMTIAEMNADKESCVGKSVQIDSIRILSWQMRNPEGIFTDDLSDINIQTNQRDFTIYLLCHTGLNFVEVVIQPDHLNSSSSLQYEKIVEGNKISIKGEVGRATVEWTNHPGILSVVINQIEWE